LLICDLEHIALTSPANVLAERHQVKVVRVASPYQATQSEVLEIVKGGISPNTRLVALSHIQFSCGLRIPIKGIASVVKERGIPFLVDGAQSVGQIPVDVADLGCDFYTLSGQKWLLGPVSTGALYVSREHRRQLEPLITTNAVEARRADGPPGLARFSLASSNPALLAGFTASVELALEIGIQNIEQHVKTLSNLLRTKLNSTPATLLSPDESESTSGLVTYSFNCWSPLELVKTLQTRFGIIVREVDYPAGVRFSMSHFNAENEVERVAAALRQLARA
jgi:L-cysteine/cystine lyase